MYKVKLKDNTEIDLTYQAYVEVLLNQKEHQEIFEVVKSFLKDLLLVNNLSLITIEQKIFDVAYKLYKLSARVSEENSTPDLDMCASFCVMHAIYSMQEEE